MMLSFHSISLISLSLSMLCGVGCLAEPSNAAKGVNRASESSTTQVKDCDMRTKTPQQRIAAELVHIVDGDTVYLRFTETGLVEKIRLADIDAPECKKTDIRQPLRSAKCVADDEYLGLHAYDYIRRRIGKKRLSFRCEIDQDSCDCKRGYYGRLIGRIDVDGNDLSQGLVENGLAHIYVAGYDSSQSALARRNQLCQAMQEARRSKRGFWGDLDRSLRSMSTKKREGYARYTALCASTPE